MAKTPTTIHEVFCDQYDTSLQVELEQTGASRKVKFTMKSNHTNANLSLAIFGEDAAMLASAINKLTIHADDVLKIKE